MKRFWLIVLGTMLALPSCLAQINNVTVTATVTDPTGNPLAFANLTAALVDSQGNPVFTAKLVDGSIFRGSPVRTTLSSSGSFSLPLATQSSFSIPQGAQWNFTTSAPQNAGLLVFEPAWTISYTVPITQAVDISAGMHALSQSISFVNLQSGQSTFVGNINLAAPPPIGGTSPNSVNATTITATSVTAAALHGNADTATALQSSPSPCGGGQFVTGIQANGNANCGTPAVGSNISGQATGVLPLPTAPNAIGAQSHLDDGVSNPNALTSLEDLLLPTSSNLATGLRVPTANAAVTTYSVLAYGAVHDGVNVICSITATSHTLTCPSGTFTSSAVDVGKFISFYSWTAQPLSANPPVTTISAFTDSAHVTMTAAALNTNGVIGVWYGTDNTPGYNNCKFAVLASPTHAGTCTIPNLGYYLFATAPYAVQIPSKDDGSYGTGAGGTGAVLAATLSGNGIGSCSVSNGGSGYTDSSTLQTTISGGCTASQLCGEADVTATTNGTGSVASCSVVLPGFGFTSAPTVAVAALGGDGATATATVTGGTMNVPTLGAGGSGYIASSTLDWYALNSGGSTCTATQTIGGTPIVGHGTVPTNSSGAASGTMTVTVNATGCGATPPIIIFGDAACNSGTLGSPVWGQCANLPPLNPNTIPVSIAMAPGVNWAGVGGQSNVQGGGLIGTWDFKTVDINQSSIFGGRWQSSDITNLTMTSFWNIFANNNANYANPSGLTMNGAFCLYTGATDLGFNMSNLNCNAYAPWTNGGAWNHRADFPRGQGGFFDAESISNVISRPLTAYGAIPSAIDDLFDTYFWRSGYSQASTDFLETCKFPNPAGYTQRQTSHSLLDVAHQGNAECLRGPTGAGLNVFTRDNRASGPAIVNTLILKGPGYRPIFQGDAGGFQATGWSSEATVALTGTNDPYRNATQQEGGIIIVDAGSSAGHFGNFNGFAWNGSTVNRAIWSISAQGDPTASAWQNNSGSQVTNSQIAQNPQFTNQINFRALCIGCDGSGYNPFDIYGVNAGTKFQAFRLMPSSTGVNISVGNFVPSFVDVLDMTPGAFTVNVPFTGTTTINATTGFKVAGAAPSGHYLCGNGTNYVDSATTCSGGTPSAFAAVTITSHAGTLATAGKSFSNGTVALDHTSTTTINVSGLASGANFNLELVQDSSGANTLTMGTGCTWLVGSGSGFVASTTPTLTAGASGVNVLSAIYDGTNCMYNIR